jgi:transcriptional regulator with XRE-family HTH domain
MTTITATQKILAENLKRIRKEKQLHQSVVAERSGVIASTYSRIESCQVSPNLSTLEKLAEAMQVPLMEFFREEKRVEPSLLEKLEQLNAMSEYNRNVVEIMIDTLLEKDTLEKAQQVKMKKRLDELDKVKMRKEN